MTAAASAPARSIEATLKRLVVKDRVSLGGLGTAERGLAMGLVWAALPAAAVNEPAINAALKQALAGPACWLATDHVELRRWLVDSGWLCRDGYGRVYEPTRPEALAPAQQAVAGVVQCLAVGPWVAQVRQQHLQQRAERQFQWQRQA